MKYEVGDVVRFIHGKRIETGEYADIGRSYEGQIGKIITALTNRDFAYPYTIKFKNGTGLDNLWEEEIELAGKTNPNSGIIIRS